MDDLLRQSEQQARNAGPEGGTRPDLDAFVQPLGAQWTPNEPLGADAELGRSLDKVLQQLEWLQCQRQANALDTQLVQDSLLQLNELDPSQGLNTGQSTQPSNQPKVLLVLHTGVSNWQELANELPSSTDLLLLEQHSSGLQQISDSLSCRPAHQAYDGLMLLLPQAIDGVLAFGSDHLSLETLQRKALPCLQKSLFQLQGNWPFSGCLQEKEEEEQSDNGGGRQWGWHEARPHQPG